MNIRHEYDLGNAGQGTGINSGNKAAILEITIQMIVENIQKITSLRFLSRDS